MLFFFPPMWLQEKHSLKQSKTRNISTNLPINPVPFFFYNALFWTGTSVVRYIPLSHFRDLQEHSDYALRKCKWLMMLFFSCGFKGNIPWNNPKRFKHKNVDKQMRNSISFILTLVCKNLNAINIYLVFSWLLFFSYCSLLMFLLPILPNPIIPSVVGALLPWVWCFL